MYVQVGRLNPLLGLFHCALHPLPFFHGGVGGAVASGKLLERRGGGTNSVGRTGGNVLRLRVELSRRAAEVGTVGGTGADTVREVGSELHILVASSSENLLLFIKCRGLREGDTAAATVRYLHKTTEMRSGIHSATSEILKSQC